MFIQIRQNNEFLRHLFCPFKQDIESKPKLETRSYTECGGPQYFLILTPFYNVQQPALIFSETQSLFWNFLFTKSVENTNKTKSEGPETLQFVFGWQRYPTKKEKSLIMTGLLPCGSNTPLRAMSKKPLCSSCWPPQNIVLQGSEKIRTIVLQGGWTETPAQCSQTTTRRATTWRCLPPWRCPQPVSPGQAQSGRLLLWFWYLISNFSFKFHRSGHHPQFLKEIWILNVKQLTGQCTGNLVPFLKTFRKKWSPAKYLVRRFHRFRCGSRSHVLGFFGSDQNEGKRVIFRHLKNEKVGLETGFLTPWGWLLQWCDLIVLNFFKSDKTQTCVTEMTRHSQ